ncbi:MAG: DUF1772 domain-containing protein [Saprospiraceae bacterium]|nr:DUF1772 domain-containing protein [Saprospiraceae bacterium]MBK7809972.1 DUF1772 domain-containing protein [Saprospiraceae bacterium]MBK9629576.1 DUF1772 domain-containing protein [Saprospiraceae bacterium]
MKSIYLKFINILLAALLAGTSFGIWFGMNPMKYSASSYLDQQQNLVISLNTIMVTLVIAATLVTGWSALQYKQQKAYFALLGIAALCFLSCLLISRFGNLPIQNEILSWSYDSMPENWTSLRDSWWNYHILRTIAELIALVLVVWVYLHMNTQNKN